MKNVDEAIKMAEFNKINAEIMKMMVDAEKTRAETLKLQTEAIKLQKETKYYPMIIVVSASIATTITTMFALFQWLIKQ